MNQPVTRRDFLQLLALSSAAAATAGMFGACHRHAKPTAATSVDLFAAWEQIRQAARDSQDHLPAMAEKLVAAKDPAAIHAFVRDQIVTYPDSPVSFTSPYNDRIRWGARATLRCGAGTAREKSELLANLLSRAGFKAEVVSGKLKSDVADARQLLLRKVAREFNPNTIDGVIDSLRLNLKAGTPTAGQTPDERPRYLAQRVAPETLSLAPQDKGGFPWEAVTEAVPLVKVEVGGEVKYANVIVPGAVFGASYTQATPDSAKTVYPLAAQVTLQIATTLDPRKRLTLLEGKWDAADLAGRQLIAGFTPAYDFDSLLQMTVGEINSFTPILLLRGTDLNDEASRKLSFVGDKIFTTWGDVIAENEQTGEVLFNDEAIGKGEGDAALEARVKTLELTAMPDSFPTIRVRVKALDAEGQPVGGLSPQAFMLREENQSVNFTLRRNQIQKPRVLLLFDLSDSIPAEFRKDSAARIGRQITEQVLALNPNAEVKAATLYDVYLSAAGEWTNDAEQIEQGIGKLSGVGSYMWAGLAEAAKFKPTVIVFFTDGAASDKPDPVTEAIIGRQAPIVLLAVGKTEQETIDRIVKISGGKAFAVNQPDAAVKVVGEYLKRVEAEPYTLVYPAPLAGPEERHLAIKMPNAAAQEAQAVYRVPPENQRVASPQLSGIYLTVRVGEKEVTRTLAGYEGDEQGQLQPDKLDAVSAALFDTTMLSFEGAAPSVSIWIDEVLTNKLKWRPFLEAARAKDKARLLAEIKKGLPHIPPELVTMNLPINGIGVSDGESLTFENDLRVIIHARQSRFGTRFVTRRADILPISTWSTAAKDSQNARALTIERTSRLSFVEAAVFPNSAAKALDGVSLTFFKPGASAAFGEAPDKDAALRQAWNKLFKAYDRFAKFAPSSGSPVSTWVIEPATGTALAVLPDGSGGGTTSAQQVERVFERGETLLSVGGAINSLAVASSLPISIWLILEKTKLKKLRYATMRIAQMDAPASSAIADDALSSAACDAIKLVLGEIAEHIAEFPPGLIGFGGYTWGVLDRIDAVAEVFGHSVDCPGLS